MDFVIWRNYSIPSKIPGRTPVYSLQKKPFKKSDPKQLSLILNFKLKLQFQPFICEARQI